MRERPTHEGSERVSEEREHFPVCSDTGYPTVDGDCEDHGGNLCLIYVPKSYVRHRMQVQDKCIAELTESTAKLLEARAAQFSRLSVAAHGLERMAREIRDGAHEAEQVHTRASEAERG